MHVFKLATPVVLGAVFFLTSTLPAAAALPWGDLFGTVNGNDLSTVSENIVNSLAELPGFLSALSYMLGILLAFTALMKLKEHVENPSQVPLRSSLARFLIGGGLFALPWIYEAMKNAITNGDVLTFDPTTFGLAQMFSAANGMISTILGGIGIEKDFNFIMASIIASLRNVPGLISAFAYLFGLYLGILGLLKLKDHIENPDQTALKEAVIRLLVGGVFFALPNLFEALRTTIDSSSGEFDIGTILTAISDLSGIMGSAAVCNPLEIFGDLLDIFSDPQATLGNTLCAFVAHTSAFQAFLAAISYLFGMVLAVWGVLKIQDHVLSPSQTPIWDGISKLLTAGCFFAMPFVVSVIKNTVAPASLIDNFFNIADIIDSFGSIFDSIFGDPLAKPCEGLDGAVSCFVTDIFTPTQIVITTFATFAGMVLIMIGISRLLKSAQEGARAPGGLGTMMTFVTGGALVSYNGILGAVSGSMFSKGIAGQGGLSYATLKYAEGMSETEVKHVQLVINSITQFMVLVGMISFARGLFIIRNVAEGNGQASLMAGFTHVIGGAMAVNLGPLMNAVQASLGVAGYGIAFGAAP